MAKTGSGVRISVVGLGTVGTWLLRAIDRDRERLRDRYGADLRVVGLGSLRDGFVYSDSGIDIEGALGLREAGTPLAELEGVAHWPTALAGIEATETDVLVEVSQSPQADGEPGLSHMRAALERGASVATSNKWPVALAGLELRGLAAGNGVGFRAESTVMSGTPVLSTLIDGLAGATPIRLRGILNASVNFICTRMDTGSSYRAALAEARTAGLTEPDPSADVDGLDSVAKLMILSALVFGRPLSAREVAVRALSEVPEAEFEAASGAGRRIREVAVLDPESGRFAVEATALDRGDPLFEVEGTLNAVRMIADPLGEVSITGPGAGPELAGQGVLSDLIALSA
jgi:homoserine dehydrogenase